MAAHPNNKEGTSITRRQALQVVLVTGSGIVTGNLLAACDSNPNQTAQKSAGNGIIPTPRSQTVVINQDQFTVFDSFNPFIPNGQQYEAGYGQVCKEFLFYFNLVTGEIKPWLATAWKYNADFTSMTLTLNPKAHWNDGQPFTSKDVKFSVEMVMSNPALIGSGEDHRRFVKDITTPDDHTVVFNLKTTNPRYHYYFICTIVGGQEMAPEHIWSKQDPMKFKNNPPVNTGPYKFDRAIPNQFMYVWKKDPNYWNKDELDPKPEYVVYHSGPTNQQDAEIESFKRAEIDVPAIMDYTHGIALKNSGYQNIEIETKFRDPCPRAIAINCDPSKGLLADPRMHWVVSYLLDRKTLGSSVWFIPTPPAQYPWADYKGNDKWSNAEIADKYALTYDPAKAAALLDEMGAKVGAGGKRFYQGKQLTYEVSTSAQVGQPEYINGQKLADELTKVGIDSTIRYYQGATWLDRVHKGQFDMTTYWACGLVLDPEQWYTQFESNKTLPVGQDASNGGNFVRSRYTDLDTIAKKLDDADPNDPKSKPLFDQALETYYKTMPFVPIYQTTYPTIFNTTYWTGWPTDDNLYQVPSNWWGQFMFVIGSLKPTGKS